MLKEQWVPLCMGCAMHLVPYCLIQTACTHAHSVSLLIQAASREQKMRIDVSIKKFKIVLVQV